MNLRGCVQVSVICALLTPSTAIAEGTVGPSALTPGITISLDTPITLSVGVAQQVRFREDLKYIQIGDPTVADFNIISRQIGMIIPKKVGQTNIIFFDEMENAVTGYMITVGVARDMSLWVGGKVFPYICGPTHCDPVDPMVSGKDAFDVTIPRIDNTTRVLTR